MQASLSEMMNVLQVYPNCAYIVSGVFNIIVNSNNDIPAYLPYALSFLYQTLIDP